MTPAAAEETHEGPHALSTQAAGALDSSAFPSLNWVKWYPPKTHVYLAPKNVTLFGNRVFADINKLNEVTLFRVDPETEAWGPCERTDIWTQTQEGGHVEMEAEAAAMWLHAKEHPGRERGRPTGPVIPNIQLPEL